MALIRCEECDREISDRALACPGCGAPTARTLPQPKAVQQIEQQSPATTPPEKAAESKKVGFLDPKANLRGLSWLALVLLIGWIAYSYVLSKSPKLDRSLSRPRTLAETASAAVRSPQVMVDETWRIGAGGMKWMELTIPSRREVRFTVSGVRSTKKGFSVYRVNADQLPAMKQGKKFITDPRFTAKKVTRVNNKFMVPAGRSAFVVRNSENLLNAMTVKVKIVSDPAN